MMKTLKSLQDLELTAEQRAINLASLVARGMVADVLYSEGKITKTDLENRVSKAKRGEPFIRKQEAFRVAMAMAK